MELNFFNEARRIPYAPFAFEVIVVWYNEIRKLIFRKEKIRGIAD